MTEPLTAQWYYGRKGQQLGPITEAQLRQLAASGQLLQTDSVWKKGMAQWVKAGQIKELFPPVAKPLPQTASTPRAVATPQSSPPQDQGSDFDTASWTSTDAGPSVKSSTGLHRHKKKRGNSLPWGVIAVGGLIVGIGLATVAFLNPFGSSPTKHVANKDVVVGDRTTGDVKGNRSVDKSGGDAVTKNGSAEGRPTIPSVRTKMDAGIQQAQSAIDRLTDNLTRGANARQTQGQVPGATRPLGHGTASSNKAASRPQSVAPQRNPDQDTSPKLAAYYSTSDAALAKPDKSWSFDNAVAFPRSKTSVHNTVILLDADTFAFGGAHFPVTICRMGTNTVLSTANDVEPPSYGIYHSESAHCILWTAGTKPPKSATLHAWNYRTKTLQTSLQVQSPSDSTTHSTEGACSPDKTLIATGMYYSLCGNDPSPVRIWKAATQEKLCETDGYGPVAFSPDGSLLAFGERKKQFRGCVLWDYRADKKVILRRPDNKYVNTNIPALAFVPHTPLVAVLTNDHPGSNRVELWDSREHKFLAELRFPEGISTMTSNSIAASTDGMYLVAGLVSAVGVCHLPSGSVAMLRGCKGPFFSVSISADGSRIAATNQMKEVLFWTRRSDGTGQFTFNAETNHSQGDEEPSGKADNPTRTRHSGKGSRPPPITYQGGYDQGVAFVQQIISNGGGKVTSTTIEILRKQQSGFESSAADSRSGGQTGPITQFQQGRADGMRDEMAKHGITP